MSGPCIDEDPDCPLCAPSSVPRFWISLMRVMRRVVTFFGRVAILIDQSNRAFQISMPVFFQMLDIPGLLYPELARYVFQLLGFRTPRVINQSQSKAALTAGTWDALWENITKN